MMVDQSCPINSPDLLQIETVAIQPENRVTYQEAVTLAKNQAEQRFEEYMLISWYDRDRDFESPPNSTECAEGCQKIIVHQHPIFERSGPAA
ncbi:MAG: AF1514 family protein [Thermodesulfobacteriota bacterium]|nr:AF1514 family protein [Thermodesulfobacteriota bacterium]